MHHLLLLFIPFRRLDWKEETLSAKKPIRLKSICCAFGSGSKYLSLTLVKVGVFQLNHNVTVFVNYMGRVDQWLINNKSTPTNSIYYQSISGSSRNPPFNYNRVVTHTISISLWCRFSEETIKPRQALYVMLYEYLCIKDKYLPIDEMKWRISLKRLVNKVLSYLWLDELYKNQIETTQKKKQEPKIISMWSFISVRLVGLGSITFYKQNRVLCFV